MLKSFFPFQSKQLLGIDIGSSSVKVIALSHNGSTYKVDSFGYASLPENAIVAKEIKDSPAVVEALKRAVADSGTSLKSAAVALADSSVITKIIILNSDLTDAEMEAQIYYEASNHIPYPIQEVRLDFQPLEPVENDPRRVRVLLVASRASLVDSYVTTFAEAGLNLRVVDVESYALARSCYSLNNVQEPEAKKIYGIIKLGHQNCLLTICQNDNAIFSRSENFGTRDLFNAIQMQFGSTLEEAQKMQADKNKPENYESIIIEPFQQNFIEYVKRGLQFFSAGNHDHEVEELILSGGGAHLPNLAGFIEKTLELPTIVANPLQNLLLPRSVDPAINSFSPSLLLSCGLALRSEYT